MQVKLSNFVLSAVCAFGLSAPAMAQNLEIVGQSGDYQISRVAASKVCFAVLNLNSDTGRGASYATFKTTQGDRWQVAGFVDDDVVTPEQAELWITFDGAIQMRRKIGFSKGDFVLPFTTDEELAGFDSYVENANLMTLKLIEMKDEINVDMDGLRAARTELDTCLEGMK